MRDSNVANAAKESAQAEFPHGLLEICTVTALTVSGSNMTRLPVH
jgi:hypothetical protein